MSIESHKAILSHAGWVSVLSGTLASSISLLATIGEATPPPSAEATPLAKILAQARASRGARASMALSVGLVAAAGAGGYVLLRDYMGRIGTPPPDRPNYRPGDAPLLVGVVAGGLGGVFVGGMVAGPGNARAAAVVGALAAGVVEVVGTSVKAWKRRVRLRQLQREGRLEALDLVGEGGVVDDEDEESWLPEWFPIQKTPTSRDESLR